jgi:hypothetical protein
MHQMAMPPIETAEPSKRKLDGHRVSKQPLRTGRQAGERGDSYWLKMPLYEVLRFNSSSVQAAPIRLTT